MKVQFHKGQSTPDALTCIREDGTVAEAELSPGSAYHDIAHFVVETNFGYHDGFFGTIAAGHGIHEYNLPNSERAFQISPEGYHAEFLATLVQSAVPTGQVDKGYVEMLRAASAAQGLPFPELPSQAILEDLVRQAREITAAWVNVPAGGRLELRFE